MTLVVAGCSLSSGWGFDDVGQTWPCLVGRRLEMPLHNLAQTSASNTDIFLSALRAKNYSMRLVQWSALNRITVSPSPVNDHVILSVHDRFLSEALPGASQQEIKNFTQVLSMLNQDWKPYFDLVDMIEVLQEDTRTYFINGLLPWNTEFFTQDWSIPFRQPNDFLESLLQVTEFDDKQLALLLKKVLAARTRIDQSRWINLAPSWNSIKVDTVSADDAHPGPNSQIKYADQVFKYILA
jgi:hypothetical protein